ncbi:MAG: ATP-binding protein [Chitinispirillaceae bacterium]|nr:ATP-binding protein [Chitinispirillaceae bacterium]
MEIVPRLFNPPKDSFFLFGPRGTGKSTWLKSYCPDALWVNLINPDEFRTFIARPERLRYLLDGRKQSDRKIVVIDEVQKLPEILGLVHAVIEEKRGWQFILTGSSARKLKRTGVDLLAGRAILRSFHPFLAAELGKSFNLAHALKTGCLPLVCAASRPQDALSTYIGIYMNEEVKSEGIVRNIGGFSRFLEAISFSHGNVLNITNVARECHVGQRTVSGFVTILEDLLLSFRLPVFTRKAERALVAHPKFYFFDAGVYRSIRPMGPLDNPAEIDGAALEGLVAQHLRAWVALRGKRADLFYWRTRAGNEVDFVVYGADVFTAIEVKNTDKVRSDDLRGLRSFIEEYPESTALLLYRGRERLKKNNVLYMPVENFLLELRPDRELKKITAGN